MKNILRFLFVIGAVILSGISATAQQYKMKDDAAREIVIDLMSGAGSHARRGDASYCSFFGKDWRQVSVRSPAVPSQFYNTFNDNVDLIKKYARVNKAFNVRVANVPNAAAVISKQNQKYLLFNQNFLTSIKTYARNRQAIKVSDSEGNNTKLITAGARDDWLVMSVVAHEVGHHLAGHTLRIGNQPYNELQADWFTGYLLQKMGAHVTKAREMQGLGAPCGTITHPLQKDRLAAVTAGWVQACEEDGDCNAARIDLTGGQECQPTPATKPIRMVSARKPKAQQYDLICKLRDSNYLVKSGAVYKNVFDFREKRSMWKVAGDLSFNNCNQRKRLADGAICLNGGTRKGGVLLEGTLINADIPVGVCAPCAPGVCPTSG